MSPSPTSQTPNPRSEILISYFRSGWAFLIPYLAAYLLYAWLKGPVNPVSGEGLVKGVSESVGVLNSQLSTLSSQPASILRPPCLLHVYWFLHGLHLILGCMALRAWWRNPTLSTLNSQLSTAATPSPLDRLWPLIPWLCLALIFWIPGVYLEWPADPWEHLRRINEWRVIDIVTSHSSWLKSSYFIPYSLLSWAMGLKQIFLLDFYFTGICLLLSWQYFRLARACDLGDRGSMVFVILQALLFGNNIFSFYRYYGISSSIYAQLGAIALIRIALETAKSSNVSLRPLFFFRNYHLSTVFCPLLSIATLLALVAFNHQQGIGIAALGIGAVIMWSLIERKRSLLWWYAGVILVTNALFLWCYHQSAIVESYRAQGWLNVWYGFNILDHTSPAGGGMQRVVSLFGLTNLVAALFLIRRNQVTAWLTVTPFIALLVPCISIPFASILSNHNGGINIVTFQRMFFAIPQGMAIVCLGAHFVRERRTAIHIKDPEPVFHPDSLTERTARQTRECMESTPWSLDSLGKIRARLHKFKLVSLAAKTPNLGAIVNGILVLTLTLVFILPENGPSYNRIWHSFVIVTDDLSLRDIFAQYERLNNGSLIDFESKVVTTQAGTALIACEPVKTATTRSRTIGQPVTESIAATLDFLGPYSAPPPLHNIGDFSSATFATHKTSTPIQSPNLIADFKAKDPTAWIALAGHAAEFVTKITDLPDGSSALQNPPGKSTYVFTSPMIPVKTLKSYRLEISVRQLNGNRAIAYLAVAWYDADGRFLESCLAAEKGAGSPRGWMNGTYSYFGLMSQAPTAWTKFGISFGLGEEAAIPPRGCFIRVGALLNENGSPAAVVQLTNFQLFEKFTPTIELVLPRSTNIYSSVSQAALLSSHWPAQQVMVDRSGTREIQEAAENVQLLQKKFVPR